MAYIHLSRLSEHGCLSSLFLPVQRFLLFQRRNLNVYPTNETVAQVFARLSALRDALDGPQVSLLVAVTACLHMMAFTLSTFWRFATALPSDGAKWPTSLASPRNCMFSRRNLSQDMLSYIWALH